MRYRAFGADRYTWGTTPTTYRYTGQRQESAIGLYYYNARWYDPALARFAQADTIVPGAGNPQHLNRFSYTLNNPLRYTDPTGHKEDWSYGGGGGGGGGGVIAIAFGVGAGAGALISYIPQVSANLRQGMPPSEAALNVDWGNVLGSAVGGGVSAAAVALGVPFKCGLLGRVALGGIGGISGGTLDRLTEATVDHLGSGEPLDTGAIRDRALAAGVGDPASIIADGVGGAAAAAAGYGLEKITSPYLGMFQDQTRIADYRTVTLPAEIKIGSFAGSMLMGSYGVASEMVEQTIDRMSIQRPLKELMR